MKIQIFMWKEYSTSLHNNFNNKLDLMISPISSSQKSSDLATFKYFCFFSSSLMRNTSLLRFLTMFSYLHLDYRANCVLHKNRILHFKSNKLVENRFVNRPTESLKEIICSTISLPQDKKNFWKLSWVKILRPNERDLVYIFSQVFTF